MLSIVNEITGAFLDAIEGLGTSLSSYSLLILGICFLISYYREYSATVMSSGTGLGDALAHFLTLMFACGCYMFVLFHLFPLANAALETVFAWGLAGSAQVGVGQIRSHAFIMEAGLKSARNIADFDTWFRAVQSTVRLAAHPGDLIAYWCIVLSFIGITAHHMMMLIEYNLAVALGAVLIPWGVWRVTSGVAEFAFGWLTGGLIRALVSSAIIGIATPAFELLARPVPGSGFFTIWETLVLMGGSMIFLVLAWCIPAQAARLAGQASLGLTGSTLFSAAMSTARFGLMSTNLWSATTRVISPLLGR
jgi:type IV secretory pathway TrbL component